MAKNLKEFNYGDFGHAVAKKSETREGCPAITVEFYANTSNYPVASIKFHFNPYSKLIGSLENARLKREQRFEQITAEEMEPLALSVLRNPAALLK